MNKNTLYFRDGHIHTPFCPHGSDDSFDLYVKKALEMNLKEMSFTEHMPFSSYFLDDRDFLDECSLKKDEVMNYFESVNKIKEKYCDKIKINVGMEVDFVDGLEEETIDLLNTYGPHLEDSLLSVHFIKIGNEYMAIDGIEGFERAIELLGSVEKVYDKYYETLLKAVKSDLGKYKPKRIGHPNLIRRFCELYPIEYKNHDLLDKLAREIKKNDYEVDVNTAGLRKKYCGEIYVNGYLKELIKKYNIKTVFGSDAHDAEFVGSDFDKF